MDTFLFNTGDQVLSVEMATYTVHVTNNGEQEQLKLSALNTAPASATATGTTGEVRITAGFIYVCVSSNVWVRSALTTW